MNSLFPKIFFANTMANGFEANQERLNQLSRLGRELTRRSRAKCELCGQAGVSSEIYLVEEESRRFVVKRALEKLKVEADWFVDISRNESEFAYIDAVSKFAPKNVPQVLAKGDGYFAMEYLGSGFKNWKQCLLKRDFNVNDARWAGSVLSLTHQKTWEDEEVGSRFDNAQNFWDLRLDPYLMATAENHPELREYFLEEADRLNGTRKCLVHGDFSPKNLLVSDDRLVVLDCEVANYGDPVFDFCFLVNHLLLKALWHSPNGSEVLQLVRAFSKAYFNGFDQAQNTVRDFTSRGGRLLALLLLARVDGKSPVEYLTSDSSKDFVRKFVSHHLNRERISVGQLVQSWFAAVT